MDQYGWTYQATLVAEHERITLDAAYELSLLQCLNDLAYLKSKAEHDREMIKKIYGKKN